MIDFLENVLGELSAWTKSLPFQLSGSYFSATQNDYYLNKIYKSLVKSKV